MKFALILPILAIPTMAFAQSPGGTVGGSSGGKTPLAVEVPPAVEPEPQQQSPELEVVAKDYMDLIAAHENTKIELNRTQRFLLGICKAHPDISECKKPK